MLPSDQMPTFFLRGWNDDDSQAAHTENRERVRKFLELQREWDSQGLSERVSEVNLADLRDVRAQLAGDDSQIELRLGSQDQGPRLMKGLNTLDKLRQTPRGPFVSYLDLNQGKRVIVGMVSGSHAVSDETDSSTDVTPDAAPAKEGGAQQSARNTKTKSVADKKASDTQGRKQAKADPKRR
jgi:hypothetical protein